MVSERKAPVSTRADSCTLIFPPGDVNGDLLYSRITNLMGAFSGMAALL